MLQEVPSSDRIPCLPPVTSQQSLHAPVLEVVTQHQIPS